MDNTEKIQDLKALTADESLNLSVRKTAAEHCIEELVNAVPAPTDEDAEVISLQEPWSRETEADRLVFDLMSKITNGKSTNGRSLANAKAEVHRRNKLRLVLAVIVDTEAHRLERLAACERVLQDHPQISKWAIGNYSAERLLSEVLPAGATKLVSAFKPPQRVSRPPHSIADVWAL